MGPNYVGSPYIEPDFNFLLLRILSGFTTDISFRHLIKLGRIDRITFYSVEYRIESFYCILALTDKLYLFIIFMLKIKSNNHKVIIKP